jgi:MazG family protein
MDKNRLSKALLVLHDMLSRLRGPGGCPWDAQQTDATLKMYLLEEAHEVLDAIERGSSEEVCQELGDLIFQVMFIARLAEERGEYDLSDVIEKVTEKMEKRHPHVFGQTKVRNAEEVADNWQRLKRREKDSPKGFTSLLQSVPLNLPALLRAHRLAERASKMDTGWPDSVKGWARVQEEFDKLKKAISSGDRGQVGVGLGDLLFSFANLAREWGLNAEHLLRSANQGFIERFREMEEGLKALDAGRDQAASDETDRSEGKGKLRKK